MEKYISIKSRCYKNLISISVLLFVPYHLPISIIKHILLIMLFLHVALPILIFIWLFIVLGSSRRHIMEYIRLYYPEKYEEYGFDRLKNPAWSKI